MVSRRLQIFKLICFVGKINTAVLSVICGEGSERLDLDYFIEHE